MANFLYSREESICPEKFLSELEKPAISYDFAIMSKDFVESGQATTKVKKYLKALGIASNSLRRFAVVSYEAEINVVAHSVGGKMSVGIYPEFVHLRFTDEGPGIKDIDKAMQPGYSTADEMVRSMGFGAGMGLPNIKDNVDIMRLSSKNKTELDLVVFF